MRVQCIVLGETVIGVCTVLGAEWGSYLCVYI